MDSAQVDEHIAKLKDASPAVRATASEELGKIGEACAVPILIETLKDQDFTVRTFAAEALGRIGEASAVPALLEALQDDEYFLRVFSVEALGRIGEPSAVPALIEAMREEDQHIRRFASDALRAMGDSTILPRRILAYSPFSPQERIEILAALRGVLDFGFADTLTLCRTVLHEEDAVAHHSAQMVLDWLEADQHLLHSE